MLSCDLEQFSLRLRHDRDSKNAIINIVNNE